MRSTVIMSALVPPGGGDGADRTSKLIKDKKSSIKLAESDKYLHRAKHITLRYHLLRNLVEEGLITLSYLETAAMTADLLTKPLPKPRFELHRKTILNN